MARKRESEDTQAGGPLKEKRQKKQKKAKDPNKPKKPQTAFLLFMEDFRKVLKEANPNVKGVAQAAKDGGERWRGMSNEEKKPYTDRAAELKTEYNKAMSKHSGSAAQEEGAGSEVEE